ncbi:site-specific recombinase, phage integrase family [Campylobacter pinnipediorum subsp. caledonicus]|uniref:Site-specific recombinase, phage integrase family n=1 Tax=Campylobacter pinnipediorum subsp. caledonicus TaxID=1874362 RepID=A0A1S6U6U2_9BACT|nr:site-specific integrase [Campylobacter pinnipediorum]AQW85865.1 site-specific recombinase, phage integrase family [Campylobacter pinnipediorum subsp. caledonicus]AQW87474.1 site-specific recombinase, phage integrase family [Campylobacter pinnipediorum subsp. caledonicus]OPA72381.1 ferredoxin [Campylobacter pinnipediorum subsp. caledonicus]
MNFNKLFDTYVSFYECILSYSTLRSDVATYNKHFRNDLGLRDVRDIKFIDIQLFCNSLIKQEYKIKTIKNILVKLRVIFKFAIKMELIEKNPCDFVELPKFDNKIYFDYSISTQKKIIKAIVLNNNETCDIFFFLLHGRRKNEVLSLKWDDVNLKNKTYTIPYKINKAKKDMIYKMSEDLYNRLYKRYIEAKKNNKLDSYVFINPNTNNKYQDLRRSWKTLLKSNNLPKIRLHDIRHLVASYSINHLKLPIEQVSFTLGHTNITTTQRYITNKIEKSSETIENLINSVI